MLQWTKDSIRQPLLLSNKNLCKDALKCFRIIQILMGDRPRPRNYNAMEHFQSLLDCGISKGQMRDEIYVQICRQLNNNPRRFDHGKKPVLLILTQRFVVKVSERVGKSFVSSVLLFLHQKIWNPIFMTLLNNIIQLKKTRWMSIVSMSLWSWNGSALEVLEAKCYLLLRLKELW